MANQLWRQTSDQTVLGSNLAVAAALSPWTRLFTPIVPRRSLHISFYLLSAILKIYTGKKKKKIGRKSKTAPLWMESLYATLWPECPYAYPVGKTFNACQAN